MGRSVVMAALRRYDGRREEAPMIRIRAGKCIAALLLAGAASQLNAQGYPQGQLTLVIPLAAGDASDTAARVIADGLSKELKVPIVPVNRPGAGGALGTDIVVKSAKDGYTISMSNIAGVSFHHGSEGRDL